MRDNNYGTVHVRLSYFVIAAFAAMLTLCACSQKKSEPVAAKKLADDPLAPRMYIIDEYADSIFYRGEWYYLDEYNLDWESKSGDRIRRHIIEPEHEVYYDRPVLNENGDTVAYDCGPTPVRLDEYGDTIVFKHHFIYF